MGIKLHGNVTRPWPEEYASLIRTFKLNPQDVSIVGEYDGVPTWHQILYEPEKAKLTVTMTHQHLTVTGEFLPNVGAHSMLRDLLRELRIKMRSQTNN